MRCAAAAVLVARCCPASTADRRVVLLTGFLTSRECTVLYTDIQQKRESISEHVVEFTFDTNESGYSGIKGIHSSTPES